MPVRITEADVWGVAFETTWEELRESPVLFTDKTKGSLQLKLIAEKYVTDLNAQQIGTKYNREYFLTITFFISSNSWPKAFSIP